MTSEDRASSSQSFDLIVNRGQRLRSPDRPQIKILLWNLLMLIRKRHRKSKLDQKWRILSLWEIHFFKPLRNWTFLLTKNPQILSNFVLLGSFGISISKFHNKILIWGRSGDLKFRPLFTMRSKLWRQIALSPEVRLTSNFACNLVLGPYSWGLVCSLIQVTLLNLVPP